VTDFLELFLEDNFAASVIEKRDAYCGMVNFKNSDTNVSLQLFIIIIFLANSEFDLVFIFGCFQRYLILAFEVVH